MIPGPHLQDLPVAGPQLVQRLGHVRGHRHHAAVQHVLPLRGALRAQVLNNVEDGRKRGEALAALREGGGGGGWGAGTRVCVCVCAAVCVWQCVCACVRGDLQQEPLGPGLACSLAR